jgi:four helix bundle protein
MGRSYRDLIAWQKAMDLVEEVYDATRSFPADELYGLRSQLRRAAVSVPSNIAEGQGRLSPGEFKQFIGTALGSLMESETQLLLAQRLAYIPATKCDELMQGTKEVGRLLNGLLNSDLKRQSNAAGR